MIINTTNSILLPNHLRGRSIHTNVIPTVSNLKNMLKKLEESHGDESQLPSWDRRSYKAYQLDAIKSKLLSSPPDERIEFVKGHILNTDPSKLGASCLDIYLVAYVTETFGKEKSIFFKYIIDNGITDKENSAQAIWQVGKGDGTYLGVLEDDGSIKDWNFFARWIKGKE
ncbi:hypothetical protein [Thalassobacillus pellis]|uniref:hypothetical protein n=1 Tax=Thalassobacillus pellis TaxID=748008 RepID=UPI001960ECD0|nr:hypothetical protein [Thalassobacillus pellis]MBM7554484.1 hypothetical protein [Thalassobacillus pellis]